MNQPFCYLLPLTAAPVTVPPFIEARVILTSASAGTVTVGPMANCGAPFVLPASAAGAYKLPAGATDSPTTVSLGNAADASLAYLAFRAWQPLNPPPNNRGCVFLYGAPPTGAITGMGGMASGFVAITGALTGALTLRAPGGWTQTINAGTTGIVALTGLPSGASPYWSFAKPDDAWSCDIVLAFA